MAKLAKQYAYMLNSLNGHALVVLAYAPLDEALSVMPANVTLDHLKHARRLIQGVVFGVGDGHGPILDQLEPASAALENKPSKDHPRAKQARLAAYCERLERHAIAFRELRENANPRIDNLRYILIPAAENLRNILASEHDPAFGKLSPERIVEAMADIDTSPTRQGGQKRGTGKLGNTGPAHIGAELIMEVEAFGYSQGANDSDAAVKKLAKELHPIISKSKAQR